MPSCIESGENVIWPILRERRMRRGEPERSDR
jgi:hypothetical protein